MLGGDAEAVEFRIALIFLAKKSEKSLAEC
jgi:hypothetical protein